LLKFCDNLYIKYSQPYSQDLLLIFTYIESIELRDEWKFEDIQGVIRSRKSMKERQYNDEKEKETKRLTTVHKTLHGKINIAQPWLL
jgi:hypothetical protein